MGRRRPPRPATFVAGHPPAPGRPLRDVLRDVRGGGDPAGRRPGDQPRPLRDARASASGSCPSSCRPGGDRCSTATASSSRCRCPRSPSSPIPSSSPGPARSTRPRSPSRRSCRWTSPTLEARITGDGRYVLLAHTVPDSVAAKIAELDLTGIGTFDEFKRYQPSGDVARSVLGRVSDDGTEGSSGLEEQYDAVLAGRPGKITYERRGTAAGGDGKGGADRRRSPAGRRGAAGQRPRADPRPGHAVRGRAGALRAGGGDRGEGRHGDRQPPRHRRDPGDGERDRRAPTRRRARAGRAVVEQRVAHDDLRARLGEQGHHDGGRPRVRGDHPGDADRGARPLRGLRHDLHATTQRTAPSCGRRPTSS